MNVNIGAFVKQCYIRMSVPMILSIAIGLLVNHFINIGGWIEFIVDGCVVVFVYFICVLIFGLSKSERGQIFGFAKRMVGKLGKLKK